jgi:hypothetical protein
VNIYAWAGSNSDYQIEIYNSFGKKVLEVKSEEASQHFNYILEASPLESGVYHVRMVTRFGEKIKILVLT